MNQQILFDLLNRALRTEIALVVTTNNPKALSHKLHAITKDSELYSPLVITVPSTPETLMIVKKTVSLHESVEGDLPDV